MFLHRYVKDFKGVARRQGIRIPLLFTYHKINSNYPSICISNVNTNNKKVKLNYIVFETQVDKGVEHLEPYKVVVVDKRLDTLLHYIYYNYGFRTIAKHFR